MTASSCRSLQHTIRMIKRHIDRVCLGGSARPEQSDEKRREERRVFGAVGVMHRGPLITPYVTNILLLYSMPFGCGVKWKGAGWGEDKSWSVKIPTFELLQRGFGLIRWQTSGGVMRWQGTVSVERLRGLHDRYRR